MATLEPALRAPQAEVDSEIRQNRVPRLSARLLKLTQETARTQQMATLEEARRANREERLVKLFRTGFRGIEKSIANHPSYSEDDLNVFRKAGFNV